MLERFADFLHFRCGKLDRATDGSKPLFDRSKNSVEVTQRMFLISAATICLSLFNEVGATVMVNGPTDKPLLFILKLAEMLAENQLQKW